MFMLRRCSMIAFELPSRSESTVKACICTIPFFVVGGALSVLTRVISRTAGWPAVTVKASFAVV